MVKWIALLSSSKESTLNYVKGENHRLPNVPFEVIQKKRKLQRSRRSDKKWRLNHLMERQINKERVFGNRRHRFYSWWWTDEGEEEWEEEEDDGQTIITTIRRRKKKVCSLGFKQEQFIQGISRDWFSTFVLGGRSTSTPNRKFMFHYCFYCGQWAWYLHSGKNLAT